MFFIAIFKIIISLKGSVSLLAINNQYMNDSLFYKHWALCLQIKFVNYKLIFLTNGFGLFMLLNGLFLLIKS